MEQCHTTGFPHFWNTKFPDSSLMKSQNSMIIYFNTLLSNFGCF